MSNDDHLRPVTDWYGTWRGVPADPPFKTEGLASQSGTGKHRHRREEVSLGCQVVMRRQAFVHHSGAVHYFLHSSEWLAEHFGVRTQCP